MKHIYLLLFSLFCAISVSAQCDELFISEYIHAGFNNRAVEIYNPTSEPVDLSQYMIGRYSNGATSPFHGVQIQSPLGDIILDPYSTFVAVIDKRDADGCGFEEPVLDGYVVLDTLFDEQTGEPVTNSLGEPLLNIQFEGIVCNGDSSIGVLYGDTYYEEYDLAGKADGFFTPVYDQNQAMYWNGNDAVCLVKGTSVEAGFANVVDVVGIIGDDPNDSGNDGWLDSLGRDMTRDNTLVRRNFITAGNVRTASESDDFPSDFNYWEWLWRPKYTFDDLGVHQCSCDPDFTGIESASATFSKIQIAPNPSNGSFVQVKAEEGISQIQVFGLDGKMVLSQKLNNAQSLQTLNIETLDSGIYVVKTVLQSGKQGVSKLLVR